MNTNMTTLPANLLAATEDLANHLLASEPFTAYHAAHGRFNADAGVRARCCSGSRNHRPNCARNRLVRP